jgi:hypothetical protein
VIDLRINFVGIAVLITAGLGAEPASSQDAADFLQQYRQTPDENRVSDLFDRVASGETRLTYEPGFGYLPSILEALQIPVSSQTLVFSKTSLQASRISPQNPRAIYFADDVYVGWVRGSPLLEISTTDRRRGAAFYTVQMTPRQTLVRRESSRCLACHRSTMTQQVPGHAVRSVMTRSSGKINALKHDYVTDHTSPFEQRWGGWYVTGDAGRMQHMGDAFLQGDDLVAFGQPNRMTLEEDIDTSHWLSPHSDIVALMVMEHQTQMQNTLVRTAKEVRSLRVGIEPKSDSSRLVIDRAAKEIVDSLLFVGEARLPNPIQGSGNFVEVFADRGRQTRDGRSLRQFDLETRLFKYPCSYLIHSTLFDALPRSLRERVYRRLWNVVTASETPAGYEHLGRSDRRAILQILRETKDDLPGYWKQEVGS